MCPAIIKVHAEILQYVAARGTIHGVRSFADVMALVRCVFKAAHVKDADVRQEHVRALLRIESVILIFARHVKHICSRQK
jgi:hypothetical protein